jgi:hypothetical protein
MAGEMITKIQHLIQSVFQRNRPQNKSRVGFAWQSEFLFIQEKSKPSLLNTPSTEQPHAIFYPASRKKNA